MGNWDSCENEMVLINSSSKIFSDKKIFKNEKFEIFTMLMKLYVSIYVFSHTENSDFEKIRIKRCIWSRVLECSHEWFMIHL